MSEKISETSEKISETSEKISETSEKISETYKIENIPIFIIHYKKLTERKEYLDNALKKEGFSNVHWFEDIDRDTMSQEQLDLYQYDPDRWYKLNAVWHQYESVPRLLTKPEIACTVSHVEIYKYIVDHDIKKAVIFEDDCILKKDFKQKLKRVLNELPDDFDACYFNDAFGWTVNNYKEYNGCGYLGLRNKNTYSPDKCVYPMQNSKCADSFMISNKCAKILYDGFRPFCLPPDWIQTPIYIMNDMKVFWAEPALTHQGSEDVYKSSVLREDHETTKKLKEDLVNMTQAIVNPSVKIPEDYKKYTEEYEDSTHHSLEKFAKDRLIEFAARLKTNSNFYLFRFGDGELRNMISTDETKHNCDFCFYYKDQGTDLIKAYIFSLTNKNAYINRWHSHTYSIQREIEKDYKAFFDPERKFLFFDIMTQKLIPALTETEKKYSIDGLSFKEEQIEFFRAIKFINRFKIYISNDQMVRSVGQLLNINAGIIVPERNCYQIKNQIVSQIKEFIRTQCPSRQDLIIIFSCGLASKVFMHELILEYPQNTYIDIGSTFDGLIKYSRDFNGTQIYRDVLLKCYS